MKRRSGQRLREAATGWLMVGPAALVLGLFSFFPLCYAFYISLHRWGIRKEEFVGFAN